MITSPASAKCGQYARRNSAIAPATSSRGALPTARAEMSAHDGPASRRLSGEPVVLPLDQLVVAGRRMLLEAAGEDRLDRRQPELAVEVQIRIPGAGVRALDHGEDQEHAGEQFGASRLFTSGEGTSRLPGGRSPRHMPAVRRTRAGRRSACCRSACAGW